MTDPMNPAQIAALMDAAGDEAARQSAIVRARNYHAGQQFVKLDARLREFLKDARGLSDADALRLNICRTVVTAVTERLIVAQLTSADAASATLAADVWRASRLDTMQDDLHEMTIRDGEAFLVLGWDAGRGVPVLVPHPRYTDVDLDRFGGTRIEGSADGLRLTGDGYGVKAFYPDDDDSQPMQFAQKQWTEVRYVAGRRVTRRRLTVYYPDRIEKYERDGQWRPTTDAPDEPWPLPWRDKAGRPLGIAVIHVRNAGLACEAWEAIPLQNAVNKLLIDLLTASDVTAFRILGAFGWMPTTDGLAPKEDGSNRLTLQPGTFVGSTSKDGRLDVIDGADMTTMLDPLNALIAWAAMVTDTPVSRFVFTRQVASSETQKQQEAPLMNKIRKRQTLIGSAYEDALALARRVAGTFGAAPASDAPYVCAWQPAETRDEPAELDTLAKKQALGVPLKVLWGEMGYTAEDVKGWTAPVAQP